MKEPFDIMIRTSLEDYVIKRVIPELKDRELRDSRKTDTGLSPREHLGLVIISFFLRWLNNKKTYVLAINNRNYDDGAVADIENNSFISVEQVYVYEGSWDNKIVQGIKDALNRKSKGGEYASGSVLLVFCNAEGNFSPNSVKEELKKSSFESVLILGPSGKGKFDYNIIRAKERNEVFNSHFELSINPSNGKCTVNSSKLEQNS